MSKTPGRILATLLLITASILFADLGFTGAYRIIKGYAPLLQTDYRIQHPLYHHDFQSCSPAQVDYWGRNRYVMVTNSLGFRDSRRRNIDPAQSDSSILVIGDSFTEGIGVNFEHTFVGIADSQVDAEILNAGVSSYSPIIYFQKLKYLIEELQLKPRHVFVYLDISDIRDEARAYRWGESGNIVGNKGHSNSYHESSQDKSSSCGHALALNFDDPLTQYFTLLPVALQFRQWKDHFMERYNRYLEHLNNSETVSDRTLMRNVVAVNQAQWTVDKAQFDDYGQTGLARASEHMSLLADLLRQHDIGLTIAVYPWPTQIWHNDLNSPQVSHWQQWAKEHHSGFINYFDDLVSRDDAQAIRNISNYYIKGDMHFNHEGNKLIAQRLINAINALPN